MTEQAPTSSPPASGESTSKEVEARLRDVDDDATRAHHAHVIARSASSAAILDVTRGMARASPALRASLLALHAAARFAPAKGIARALADDDTQLVRAHALRTLAALAHVDDAEALAPLVAARADDDADIHIARAGLARALAGRTAPPLEDGSLDIVRASVVRLVDESPLADLALVEAIAGATGLVRRVAIAALGALPPALHARALGGALAVVDDEGRALVVDVIRRHTASLDGGAKQGLAALLGALLAASLEGPPQPSPTTAGGERSSSSPTTAVLLSGLAALAPDRAVQWAIGLACAERPLGDLRAIAEAARDPRVGRVKLTRLLAAAEREPALVVSLATLIDDEVLIDGLVDDVTRPLVLRAWRRAALERTLARHTGSLVPFAKSAALVGREDGALPVALARALLSEGTVDARRALVALASAHEDEEAAHTLCALAVDDDSEVVALARDALARFVSRAVRIDSSAAAPGGAPVVVLDHRAPSGELLSEHGALLADRDGLRYALDETGAAAPLFDRPLGSCACCRRARLLVQEPDGVVCPVSGARHVKDGAHAVLAVAHATGACPKCPTERPLVVDARGAITCPACGHTEGAEPAPEPVVEDDPLLSVDVTEQHREQVGVPPAPRPVELGLFRPIAKQILAAHLFVTTTDAVLGAGIVLSIDDQTRETLAVVGAPLEQLDALGEPGARVYGVNGERSALHIVALDRELGVGLISFTPRRAERMATVHLIGMWPARSTTVLVPGGVLRARWEIAQAKLSPQASEGARAARLKPDRVWPGAGLYTSTGGLIGLASSTHGRAIGLGPIGLWLSLHRRDLGDLLRAPTREG